MPKDLIILSAKFHAKQGDKNLINNKIKKYIKEKRTLNQVKLKLAAVLLKIQKIEKLGN